MRYQLVRRWGVFVYSAMILAVVAATIILAMSMANARPIPETTVCLKDDVQVRAEFGERAHADWSLRVRGHKGTKCYFPSATKGEISHAARRRTENRTAKREKESPAAAPAEKSPAAPHAMSAALLAQTLMVSDRMYRLHTKRPVVANRWWQNYVLVPLVEDKAWTDTMAFVAYSHGSAALAVAWPIVPQLRMTALASL